MAKSKVVSVRPFLRSAGRIHGTISEEAYATFDGHLADHFSDRTKDAMAPGPHMDEQNLRMGQESVVEVDALLSGNRKEMKLWEWSKNVIMQAMGVGLFGREHPFKDKEIADAMWYVLRLRKLDFVATDTIVGPGTNIGLGTSLDLIPLEKAMPHGRK